MEYFNQASDNLARGVFDLAKVTVRPCAYGAAAYCFELIVPVGVDSKRCKKYLFSCDDEHDRSKWVVFILNARTMYSSDLALAETSAFHTPTALIESRGSITNPLHPGYTDEDPEEVATEHTITPQKAAYKATETDGSPVKGIAFHPPPSHATTTPPSPIPQPPSKTTSSSEPFPALESEPEPELPGDQVEGDVHTKDLS